MQEIYVNFDVNVLIKVLKKDYWTMKRKLNDFCLSVKVFHFLLKIANKIRKMAESNWARLFSSEVSTNI